MPLGHLHLGIRRMHRHHRRSRAIVLMVVWCLCVVPYASGTVFRTDHRSRTDLPPWSAAVGRLVLRDGSVCTATLVHPSYAVTAAACVAMPSFNATLNRSTAPAASNLINIMFGNVSAHTMATVRRVILQRELNVRSNDYALLQLASSVAAIAPLSLVGDAGCPATQGRQDSVNVSCVQFAVPDFVSAPVAQPPCPLNVSAGTHGCDTSVRGSDGAPLVVAGSTCLVALHFPAPNETSHLRENSTLDYVVAAWTPQTANVALLVAADLRKHLQQLTSPSAIVGSTGFHDESASLVVVYACVGVLGAVLVGLALLVLRPRYVNVHCLPTPPTNPSSCSMHHAHSDARVDDDK